MILEAVKYMSTGATVAVVMAFVTEATSALIVGLGTAVTAALLVCMGHEGIRRRVARASVEAYMLGDIHGFRRGSTAPVRGETRKGVEQCL